MKRGGAVKRRQLVGSSVTWHPALPRAPLPRRARAPCKPPRRPVDTKAEVRPSTSHSPPLPPRLIPTSFPLTDNRELPIGAGGTSSRMRKKRGAEPPPLLLSLSLSLLPETDQWL